jgi:hypothetical protein
MAGIIIKPLKDSAYIEKIIRIFTYFAALRKNILNSLNGGPSRDLIFLNAEKITFDNVKIIKK